MHFDIREANVVTKYNLGTMDQKFMVIDTFQLIKNYDKKIINTKNEIKNLWAFDMPFVLLHAVYIVRKKELNEFFIVSIFVQDFIVL